MRENIDFVVTWLDDADPQWRAEMQRLWSSDSKYTRTESQYRDWGTLRYWFRSVEKFAPWVRYVFFVTVGHYPDWLDIRHPKIRMIKHSDYIPEQFLPTFNSHTIEWNLHRIKGLSEQFVYFNDDTFLLRDTKQDDFFKKGLPCALAALSPVMPLEEGIYNYQFNGVRLINQSFQKKEVIQSNWRNWFCLKYGKHLLKTFLMLPWGNFTGFFDEHLPNSLLRSTFEELWCKFPDELTQTCLHPFRSASDVNQWLASYWQICSSRFYPRPASFGRYFDISADNESLYKAIRAQRYKTICANDNKLVDDYPLAKQKLISALQDLLPDESAFELR